MIRCCKNCVAPKRHIGCHSSCPEYLDEKKEHDRVNKIRVETLKAENDILECLLNPKRKKIKKRIKNYYR